jgi:hypothetical protein
MHRENLLRIAVSVCAISSFLPSTTFAQTQSKSSPAAPLVFEENRGQAPKRYHYVVRRGSIETLYSADGIDIVVPEPNGSAESVHLCWLNDKSNAKIESEELLPGHSNYFLGADSTRWVTNVQQFGRLRYRQIYPGIDLVFHGTADDLEHDFVVAPGADPLQLGYRINRPARIMEDGDLDIQVGQATVRLQKPIAYQEVAGEKQFVSAQFKLEPNGVVKFRVGTYDHSSELIVDPIFNFSTYLAGTGQDSAQAVAVDAAGNVYVTGSTTSADFPTTQSKTQICPTCGTLQGNSDVFVSKLDPTGHTLLVSTYVGGTSDDFSGSVAVDSAGNMVVTGTSTSTNFPNAGSAPTGSCQINVPCLFAVSIKADGSGLNYSGLYGPIQGFASNYGRVAVDPARNAYLATSTFFPGFPFTPGTVGTTFPSNPGSTGVVVKIDTTGKVVYSTAIPGNASINVSFPNRNFFPPNAISVDAAGQVTLTGQGGVGLPGTPGVLQPTLTAPPDMPDPTNGFLLQLNANATAFNFATYLPGTDNPTAVIPDGHGNFYIAGSTGQSTLPVSANAFQKAYATNGTCTCPNGFVVKVDGAGKTMPAATYLGGQMNLESIGTIFVGAALDKNSNVFVGGQTDIPNLPLKNPLLGVIQPFNGVPYMAEFSPDLSTLLFGSYLSPKVTANGEPGRSSITAVAMDSHNAPIVVGITDSTIFPTTANSFQPSIPSSNPPTFNLHSFVSKLDLTTASAGICFDSTFFDFGTTLINTPTTQTLHVTNCGNAPLEIASITSAPSVVTAQQSCGTIAPGNSCAIKLAFTPTFMGQQSGILTFTENTPVASQILLWTGNAGAPVVDFPTSISVSDLVVGTSAPFFQELANLGDGAWLISSMTVVGADFSLQSSCPSSVAPSAPGGPPGFCDFNIVFSPTTAGVRRGSLRIIDNTANSPHIIPITGNGLTAYTTPSITSARAVPADRTEDFGMVVTGNNFFPNSQILLNGTPHTTNYFNENNVITALTAADIATAPTEVQVTVSTPGGGVSNSSPGQIYTALRNVHISNYVFEPHSGLLYATTAADSTTDPGKVIAIDPSQGKIVQVLSVGNGPNVLAVSDDGQLMYVGLLTDQKVAQVALPSGTVNLTVSFGTLGNDGRSPLVASGLHVLPGHPHTWAVSLVSPVCAPCNGGVEIFDDATQRPSTVVAFQPQAKLFESLNGSATTLYGATFPDNSQFTNGETPTFYSFAVSSAGLSLNQMVSGTTSGWIHTDGHSIYVSNGEVRDPSTLAVSSTVTTNFSFAGIAVDVPAGRVYYAGTNTGIPPSSPAFYSMRGYDLASHNLLGEIPLFDNVEQYPQLFRFGTNGLIMAMPSEVYFFRSSLTGGTIAPVQFTVAGITPRSLIAGSADVPIQIAGTNFAAGDTVTINGTATPAHVVSSTEIDVTVAASFLAQPGSVAISVITPAKQVGNLMLAVGDPPADASVAPSSLAFGNALVGTSPAAQNVTISNRGSTTLLIGSVTITGDFSQTNNCTTVAPGSSCSITVTFKPSAAGVRNGTLAINDNNVTVQQTVSLGGTGSDVQIVPGGTGGATATVTSGASASYSLNVTPAGGFSGQVTFSCTNLPTDASCTITPPSAMLSNAAVTVSVAIATTQQTASAAPPASTVVTAFYAAIWPMGLLGLIPLWNVRKSLRRAGLGVKVAAIIGATVTLLAVANITGCGGGGSGPSTPPPTQTSAATPAGTYTVNFVATTGAGAKRTVPLTLVVH